MVARVWFSRSIFTFSLASTAWCRPSDQRRPGMRRPGELVHDDDLAVLHHVVDVALEERVRAQALVHVVEHVHVGGVPEVLHPQQLLGVGHARLGEGDGLGLLVDDVVARLLELGPLLGLLVAGDAGARA